MSALSRRANTTASPLDRQIGWLTGISILCYLAILGLSFRFQYGEGYQQRPLLEVLLLFATLTLCYWFALWLVRAHLHRSPAMTPADSGRLLQIVVLSSLLFRLILLPSAPIQEIDYYRYLWDGRVLLAGVSPYQFAPQQIENWRWGAEHQETRHYLWQQAQQSDTTEIIFQRVHHRHVPTVYPPAAQAVFTMATLVTPTHAPLWMHLLIFKFFVLAFDVGTLFVLISLLRRLGLAPVWCLAYGWCPLLMKEVANSAHLDSIAVFFTTLSIRLFVEIWWRDRAEHKSGSVSLACAATATLALGVLAKSYPLVLVPVAGAFLLSRLKYRSALPALAFAAVLVLGYVPFLALAAGEAPGQALNWPASASDNALQAGADFGRAHQPWTGLGTFLGMWEMNDFLFMLVHENLRPASAVAAPWFVLLPASWRAGLDRSVGEVLQVLGLMAANRSSAFLLAQALMGLVLLCLTLRWAWQVWRSPEPLPLLRGVFLTLAWGWLLSAAPNPWYLLWCLPFMLFAGRLSWFLLPGLSLLYYFRFWMEYQAWGDPAAVTAARMAFDYGIIWLEYLPCLLLLFVESACLRRRGEPLLEGAAKQELIQTEAQVRESRMRSQLKKSALCSLIVIVGVLAVSPASAGPIVYLGQPCKQANRPSADGMDHGGFDALLKKYVDDKGLVAYAQWQASAVDVKALDDYLVKLGCVDLWKPTTKASLLAYWINAYNAVTLKGILREYPTTSIMNHASKDGGFNIFKDLQLWADGKPQSLDDIEHKILRKMGEPRIHFGLVCAARGCPPLANRAYTAANLDKTLVANAKHFFAQAKNLKVNATTRTVHISQLFQWYGSDFAATPQQQVLALRPYFPPQLDADWLGQGPFTVQYLDYDWALNDQAPKGK